MIKKWKESYSHILENANRNAHKCMHKDCHGSFKRIWEYLRYPIRADYVNRLCTST